MLDHERLGAKRGSWGFAVAVIVIFVRGAPVASADRSSKDALPITSSGDFLLDASFVAGRPLAMPTGLSSGVGVSATAARCAFRWGVRAALVTASESTMAWDVTQTDLQLRALAGLERRVGRGRLGMRIGAGATVIHESRERVQGSRAGASGEDLEMTANQLVPVADVEAVVGLHVFGPWLITISGGPSFAAIDGDPDVRWVSMIGIGWQP